MITTTIEGVGEVDVKWHPSSNQDGKLAVSRNDVVLSASRGAFGVSASSRGWNAVGPEGRTFSRSNYAAEQSPLTNLQAAVLFVDDYLRGKA